MRLLLFAIVLLMTSVAHAVEIRVDIDILEMAEKEVKDYGIEKSALFNEINKRLNASKISVSYAPHAPQLLVRIKSLPTNGSLATFVQVALFEETISVRTKEQVWAQTWSQVGMIIGPKDSYTKNVTDEVMNLINSFVLEYLKPASK